MLADDVLGLIELLWRHVDVFDANTMLKPIEQLQSYGTGGKMIASILNPAAIADIEAMLEGMYEVPFDASVQLTEKKPLYWVYFGAHIKTLEEARRVVPQNAFGEHLLKFFPDGKSCGGWIAFQRFEDSPIEFEYMYREKPTFIPPTTRVRVQSEAETLASELHDTALREVLQAHSVGTGAYAPCPSPYRPVPLSIPPRAPLHTAPCPSPYRLVPLSIPACAPLHAATCPSPYTGANKAERVQLLLQLQSGAAIEQALRRSRELSKKKKSSGAAASEASALLSMSERIAAITAERQQGDQQADAAEAAAAAANGVETGGDSPTDGESPAALTSRTCPRCKTATILYPAPACNPCIEQLRRFSCNHKMPLGVIETHGYNSFKQSVPCCGPSSNFPITARLSSRLYPAGYTDSARYFDRRNWISRPPSMVATWPHEYFLNGQDKLPHGFQRPSEDIRACGPSGVVFTSRPRSELRFGSTIEAFEQQNAEHANQAHFWDLVERCCTQLGVQASQLPVPDASAVAERKRSRTAFKKAQAAAKQAAAATAGATTGATARAGTGAAAPQPRQPIPRAPAPPAGGRSVSPAASEEGDRSVSPAASEEVELPEEVKDRLGQTMEILGCDDDCDMLCGECPWETCMVTADHGCSCDVRIISDGMECCNVASRFLRMPNLSKRRRPV